MGEKGLKELSGGGGVWKYFLRCAVLRQHICFDYLLIIPIKNTETKETKKSKLPSYYVPSL